MTYSEITALVIGFSLGMQTSWLIVSIVRGRR